MAKSKSLLDLHGTFRGITFVKSRIHREHIRAARGTYKSAEVNEAFKESSTNLRAVNPPAQILRDAIAQYHPHLVGSGLWPQLLSLLRKQLRIKGYVSFSKIPPFEIHRRHPLSHLLPIESSVSPDAATRELIVDIRYKDLPDFHESKYIKAYRIGAIAIFPNLEKRDSQTTAVYTNIIPLTETVSPLTLRLPVPEGAREYLVCLKIEGYLDGKINRHARTQGMRMVASGEL